MFRPNSLRQCSCLTVCHISSEDKLFGHLLALRVITATDTAVVIPGAGTQLIVTPCTLFDQTLSLLRRPRHSPRTTV